MEINDPPESGAEFGALRPIPEDLIELASIWTRLTEEDRRALIDLAGRMALAR